MSGSNEETPFATCFVQVLDANHDPIQGAWVVIQESDGGGTTDREGKKTIFVPEVPLNARLTVFHPSYVRETAQFSGSIFSGDWNNALIQRTLGPKPGDVNLTIRLGRFASAPTRVLSSAEILAQAQAGRDIGGVVTTPIKGRQGQMTYVNTRLEPVAVQCARETLTPASKPDDKTAGWARFNHDTVRIDNPEKHGRLFCIISQKCTASPQPIALWVWSPNLISGEPVEELDMIFFYHPWTGKARAKYPFGLDMVPKKNVPQQYYTSVGSNYMAGSSDAFGWDGPALIYPLIARERKAIVVLPISNQGTWDPFLAQEGVWRMCKEVSLYLHWECPTSAKYGHYLNSDMYKARAGSSLRDLSLSEVRGSNFGRPPRIRKVVLAWFSQGCAAGKSVMNHYDLPSALKAGSALKEGDGLASKGAPSYFQSNLWGCLRSRSDDFKPILSEIWDIDGFHSKTGTVVSRRARDDLVGHHKLTSLSAVTTASIYPLLSPGSSRRQSGAT